ncbi:MAG: hypothetical protein RBS72_09060 [Sedimentisphaerales bacterium]|jgi:biotin carboxyl carrier protein|nr:hypothetical protein [Sedimentisphaerales bacterium]NLZ05035.1 hypothetical protein [Phycisphaerae bacterium]HNY79151.1 hypothetical protein [Sedimentisphaerales bacterium]HOC64193.1 hypothetical protein [Sedimentisphaerales bacterium]HOH65059.1 hypothetical protein [Sedimentisphaerales bacterium]
MDATHAPAVQVGDKVRKGQNLCASEAETTCICPITGTVAEVRFDPAQHEFVVTIAPTKPG